MKTRFKNWSKNAKSSDSGFGLGATGEMVLFSVAAEGDLPHDFALGEDATQDEYEEEMAAVSAREWPTSANAIVLRPLRTKELTWRFTEAVPVIIGCHPPGHYESGIKARVTVST